MEKRLLGSLLRDKRGVSEVVASLMMILIVAAAGAILYAYSLTTFSSTGTSFQLQMDRGQERARERLVIVAVWWRDTGNQLNVTVLNYGKIDLAVDAIYIDGTPVTAFSSGQGVTITTDKLGYINFTSPVAIQNGQAYEITVVTERGSRNVDTWKAEA